MHIECGGGPTSHAADTLNDFIHELLANSVVATGVCNWLAPDWHLILYNHTVVSGVFLSADQLLRVEELAVGTSADLINGL